MDEFDTILLLIGTRMYAFFRSIIVPEVEKNVALNTWPIYYTRWFSLSVSPDMIHHRKYLHG